MSAPLELGAIVVVGMALTGAVSGLLGRRPRRPRRAVLHATYDDGTPVPMVGGQL
jgi:hypothetical protein